MALNLKDPKIAELLERQLAPLLAERAAEELAEREARQSELAAAHEENEQQNVAIAQEIDAERRRVIAEREAVEKRLQALQKREALLTDRLSAATIAWDQKKRAVEAELVQLADPAWLAFQAEMARDESRTANRAGAWPIGVDDHGRTLFANNRAEIAARSKYIAAKIDELQRRVRAGLRGQALDDFMNDYRENLPPLVLPPGQMSG